MKSFLFMLLILFSHKAFSLQEFVVSDQDRIKILISSHDINRIAFTNGRIAGVYMAQDKIHMDVDEASGQIFIKPKTDKPFTLVAVTESGITIDMHLVPSEISSESVLLTIGSGHKKKTLLINEEKEIKKLTLGIIKGAVLYGYSAENSASIDENPSLIKVYRGKKYKASLFNYKNERSEKVTLKEQDFRTESTVGITILKKNLAPNETSKIVIVERKYEPVE